jgi:RNA polymerase sigma factor (sigma-70 family)
VEAQSEALNQPAETTLHRDLERIFFAHYPNLIRAVSRVIRNHARAEELAVEAILRFPRANEIETRLESAWLMRTAVRLGLDELRRQKRTERFSSLLQFIGREPAPDELFDLQMEKDRVRIVLASLAKRDAELLVLRHTGLSYSELSAALHLKESSVGTMLSRAQKAFKNEYTRRFGHNDAQ